MPHTVSESMCREWFCYIRGYQSSGKNGFWRDGRKTDPPLVLHFLATHGKSKHCKTLRKPPKGSSNLRRGERGTSTVTRAVKSKFVTRRSLNSCTCWHACEFENFQTNRDNRHVKMSAIEALPPPPRLPYGPRMLAFLGASAKEPAQARSGCPWATPARPRPFSSTLNG